MNDAFFVEQPTGFSSTFNAIYFAEGQIDTAKKRLMSAMARFLMSDVAHYFYALIGKSWILDHARLEKHDLEAVPFPIEGTNDVAVDTLLSGEQFLITALVAERMGLDRSFTDAVQEYIDFRSGYEDSQLPPASLRRPDDAQLSRYQSMLSVQLAQIFGSQAQTSIAFQDSGSEDYFASLSVRVQRRGEILKVLDSRTVLSIPPPEQFSPYSAIIYDPSTSIIAILKPWTHVAWTIEQAFADARSVSAAILRSGAVRESA
jgi:hypothetical protein